MSKYKPLYSNLWNDPDFEKYTPQEKLIYIFLITNQAVEKSGIYKITIKQISFYTDCNKSIINDFINKLINDNKIKYDFEKGVIFIKNVFKFQKGMIKNKSVTIDITDEAIDDLVDKGFDPKMGARPLQRVIDDEIKRPLSRQLLFGDLKDGGSAHIDLVDNVLKVVCEEVAIEQVQDS